MSAPRHLQLGGRHKHGIHIGDVFASRAPAVVRTVLGSCIAVCLRDPFARIGGMNHFMLPAPAYGESYSARYGIHAMELLINQCMKHGADRRRLEAKVFGGGHVLKMRESDDNVPQRNMRFALEFLETEKIAIVARDLGGYAAREVLFFTDTGQVLLRRLQETGLRSRVEIDKMIQEERASLAPIAAPDSEEDDVTLF